LETFLKREILLAKEKKIIHIDDRQAKAKKKKKKKINISQ